jgi:hypothetical protein
MYDEFKNLISVNQHGFMKNRSMAKNLLEYASFVLNSIEGGWQVDSVYTEFLKAFDRVRHQLLLEKMSMSIEPARCLRSYLKGRIQRIRIGDAVSKDIRMTSSIPQGNKLYKRFGGHHERERLWFVRSWSTAAVYGAHSMTCVWTRLNVCRCGLYDMLCVVWVPSFFELIFIARTTEFMNRCLPQCASLTRSLLCSISF